MSPGVYHFDVKRSETDYVSVERYIKASLFLLFFLYFTNGKYVLYKISEKLSRTYNFALEVHLDELLRGEQPK